MLHIISMGRYFPEGRTFGTLVMSTEVFRDISCNPLTTPPIDSYLDCLEAVGSGRT